MENFTPIRTLKNKKKANKFLIIGNLFLVVLIAVIGFTYYSNVLLTTQQKAVQPGGCMCKDANGNTAGAGECSGSNCSCTPPLSVKNNRCGETTGGGSSETQTTQ